MRTGRDVGSIEKVGGTCIQGYPHKQNLATFKLQRGTLPNDL